jgi:UPF0271 protein
MVRLVTERRIAAIDGTDIALEAESICVHGDTPDAVSIGRQLRDMLTASGIELRPFCVAGTAHG